MTMPHFWRDPLRRTWIIGTVVLIVGVLLIALHQADYEIELIRWPAVLSVVALGLVPFWVVYWFLQFRKRGASELQLKKPPVEGLFRVSGCENDGRLADVVFVHGLDGDA